MNRAKLIIIGIVVAALLSLLVIPRPNPPLTSYQGHTVQEWAKRFFVGNQKSRDEARTAIHSLGSNAVPELIKLLNTPDPIVRRALQRVTKHIPQSLLKPFESWLQPPDVKMLRLEAAHALGELGPEAAFAVPALSAALARGDSRLCLETADALGRIGPGALPALLHALKAPDPHERRAAACGLAHPGLPSGPVIRGLFAALEDKQDYVRFAAKSSLGARGPEFLPDFVRLMRSNNVKQRVLAARSLSFFLPDRHLATPALLELSRDERAECRLAALQTLCGFQLPTPMMLDGFCAALKDSSWEVRAAAVRALSQARYRAAYVLPELASELKDASPPVRQEAARGLGRFGQLSVFSLPALHERTHDIDPSVRAAAWDSIRDIEGAGPSKRPQPAREASSGQTHAAAALRLQIRADLGPAT